MTGRGVTPMSRSVRSAERSAHLLRSELRARGLGADLAAAVVASHDDDAAALAAARRLAHASRGREPEVRTRRLRGALARRGFAAETIERAIAALSAPHRSRTRAASGGARGLDSCRSRCGPALNRDSLGERRGTPVAGL